MTRSSYYIRNLLLEWLEKLAEQHRTLHSRTSDKATMSYYEGRITAFEDVANKLRFGWHAYAKRIGEVQD